MKNKAYTVKGNKTAADVVAGNHEVIETGYTLQEAKIAAIEAQKTGGFVAAWIEEEAEKPAPRPEPRIVRSVESDFSGQLFTVVRIDGWAI